MKLTTKGRYAVTAMMDLQLHADQDRVALTEIAERQDISLSYLEQLFANLRKAGLVKGIRGPKGGYSLSRNANEISIAEILVAAEENIDLTCGNGKNCSGETDPCLTHSLWSKLSHELYSFLDGRKLSDIVPNSLSLSDVKRNNTLGQIADIPVETR